MKLVPEETAFQRHAFHSCRGNRLQICHEITGYADANTIPKTRPKDPALRRWGLPPPLRASTGQEVTVIGQDHAYFNVQDERGDAFRPVAVQNIELERIYFWEGRWRREKHPAILAYLQNIAEQLEQSRERWPSGVEWINEEIIAYNRRALERWAAEGYYPALPETVAL